MRTDVKYLQTYMVKNSFPFLLEKGDIEEILNSFSFWSCFLIQYGQIVSEVVIAR